MEQNKAQSDKMDPDTRSLGAPLVELDPNTPNRIPSKSSSCPGTVRTEERQRIVSRYTMKTPSEENRYKKAYSHAMAVLSPSDRPSYRCVSDEIARDFGVSINPTTLRRACAKKRVCAPNMGKPPNVPAACEKVIADNVRALRMMGWPVLKEDIIAKVNQMISGTPVADRFRHCGKLIHVCRITV